ncbi:MAG TPA: Wzz/FepE/Etk N-terminal domain-containing protein [Acetobacteraceae bacterium]|nr:Wzz/FepE/Etk N-terminal domain-containing protein [Acetobacteraceae bacterium]
MAFADHGFEATMDGPPADSGLQEAFRILRRHWALIAAIALLTTAAACAAALLLPRVYTASGIVAIRAAAPDPFPSAAPGLQARPDSSQVATEMVALKSRDLARQVVSALDIGATPTPSLLAQACEFARQWRAICPEPQGPPTMAARIDAFLANLVIAPTEQTGDRSLAISVGYKARDPKLAAQVVNTLIELREKQEITYQSGEYDRTAAWLDRRANELRDRWITAEQAVAQFRDKNELTETLAGDRMAPLVGQQVASAATEFTKIQADLAGAEARQNALRQALASGDKRALIRLPDQPILVSLSKTLDDLTLRRSMLGQSYRPGMLTALNATIADTERKLDQESKHALAEINTQVAVKRAEARKIEQNLIDLKSQSAALSGPLARLQTLEHEAETANKVYASFVTRANEMSNRAPTLVPTTETLSRADVPDQPSFPRLSRFLAAGMVLGLVGGAGAGWAREKLGGGYKEISRVTEQLSLPLISIVPFVGARRRGVPLRRYVSERPFSAAAEAVRSLGAAIALANRSSDAPCAVVITSAVGQEGKSTLCYWLAEAAAREGQSVLLIDGDYRKSMGMNRPEAAGFTDVLAGRVPLESVIVRDGASTMDYMPAGRPRSSAFIRAELDQLRALIAEVKRHYALVVIDAPPLLGMAEGLVFASVADQSVFVCRWQRTSRAAITSCLRRLRSAGAHMTGIVLSMVDMDRVPLYSDEYDRRSMRMMKQYYLD